jgi:hypothetical protein
MSAKNLMDGLTAYTDPEELAASSVAAQEQQSLTLSILVSLITISSTETVMPD